MGETVDQDVDPPTDQAVTREQTERLIAATERLADTNSWRKISQGVLVCVVAAVAALSVTNYLLYRQVQSTASCRANFAAARADALDDLVRTIPVGRPTTAEQARAATEFAIKQQAYLKVSDQYTDAVRHNC
jgi:cytochrome c-type biogenesis protein CcmH/NrfG